MTKPGPSLKSRKAFADKVQADISARMRKGRKPGINELAAASTHNRQVKVTLPKLKFLEPKLDLFGPDLTKGGK